VPMLAMTALCAWAALSDPRYLAIGLIGVTAFGALSVGAFSPTYRPIAWAAVGIVSLAYAAVGLLKGSIGFAISRRGHIDFARESALAEYWFLVGGYVILGLCLLGYAIHLSRARIGAQPALQADDAAAVSAAGENSVDLGGQRERQSPA